MVLLLHGPTPLASASLILVKHSIFQTVKAVRVQPEAESSAGPLQLAHGGHGHSCADASVDGGQPAQRSSAAELPCDH